MDCKANATPKKSELLDVLFWIGIMKYHPDGLSFDRIIDKQLESLRTPDAESPGDSAYHSASLSLKGFQQDATHARDHVYGLLGLTGLKIIPDYTKTTRQVLLDYVRAKIESNRGTGSELCFLDTAPKICIATETTPIYHLGRNLGSATIIVKPTGRATPHAACPTSMIP